MLFSHYLLDEIVDILYHYNPVGYELEREGSYDHEASLIFSYAYLLSPKPNVKITDESVNRLARYIKITFTNLLSRPVIDENVYGVLAQTILETAQDIEANLNNNQTLILASDSVAFDEPLNDDGSEEYDVDTSHAVVESAPKKWSVN